MNRCARCGIRPSVSTVEPDPLCEYCLADIVFTGRYGNWTIRADAPPATSWRAQQGDCEVVADSLAGLIRALHQLVNLPYGPEGAGNLLS